MATLIRKPFTLIAVGLLGGLLAAMSVAPMVAAHASQEITDVEFLDEGWWLRYREPLAPVPPSAGVPGVPADTTEIPRATLRDQTNPYKGEYTRVSAVSEGEDANEAIAAFGFDPFGLADGMPADITAGTVTFIAAPPESAPQAGDGANGQRNEGDAAMVACLVTDFFAPDFAGNYEERPPHDCEIRSPLEPTEPVNDRPAWTLDLAPFVGPWADMDILAFVLMPDPEAEGNRQFFHVAFPNKMNHMVNNEEFPNFPPPPLADLTIEAEELPDFDFDDDFGDASASEFDTFDDAGSGESFDSGDSGFSAGTDSGFDSGSSGGFDASAPAIASDGGAEFETDAPETAGDETFEEPDDEVVAQAPVAADADGGEGGFNLGYILLPLLGLGLATTLGYSLSQDPELPTTREGAVSKLMQRRAAQPSLPASPDA